MGAPLPPLPARTAAPFVLPGERASAVLVHGFTGCPIEVRLVGDALSAHGIACRAPLLPGHGEDPLALNRTSRFAWLDAVWRAFYELDERKPRFLVGSSMGGALTLQVAASLGHGIAGLVLLAPALALRPSGQIGALLARRGALRLTSAIPKEDPGGDCADPDGRAANAGYPVLPVGGIAEFDRVREDALRVLGEVRCPVATFHGAHDRTIDPVASELVARRVSSLRVERTVLPASRHLLGLDYDRAELCHQVVRFVTSLLPRGGGAG